MKSALNLKYILLIPAVFFCFQKVSAQREYKEINFRIDSLYDVGLPKSALKQVDKLDSLAQKNNDAAMQVLACVYRMSYQSFITDDAFPAIIASLRSRITKAVYPVKPVLQSVLADMYWHYYTQNRGRFAGRSRLMTPDTDFTKWDLRTVINKACALYEASLQDAEREQNTPVQIVSAALTGDSTTRYLRPALYDLLLHRALDFFLTDEASLPEPRMPFSVNNARFFSDSRTFADLTIKTSDTASILYKGIILLQRGTAFHLAHHDDEALADLDLKRLSFLHDHSRLSDKDSLYVAGLTHISSSFAAKPISADALALEGQYYKDKDSLVTAHGIFEEAVKRWPKSFGGKTAAIAIKNIETKFLSAVVEGINTAGRPVLSLLKYTNVKQARILVYRLTNKQFAALEQDENWELGQNIADPAKLFKALKSEKPVQTHEFELPGTSDYKAHSAEFGLDAMSPGTYAVVVKSGEPEDRSLTGIAVFKLTGLSFVSRLLPSGQKQLIVADRGTGAPLKDVKVSISTWRQNRNGKIIQDLIDSGRSDAKGMFTFRTSENRLVVSLTKDSDSYVEDSGYFPGILETTSWNPSLTRTIIFTDRQLYRPGQTVYFKALQISIADGKSTLVQHAPLKLSFRDINGKEVSSLNLETNEYGSVQGAFTIPVAIAAGQEMITSENGMISFNVESYKRPTFQTTFLPVTKVYKPGDTIKLKGKVTAFSGYGISNAKVAIHITRTQRFRFFGMYNDDVVRLPGAADEIETDTTRTDEQGNFHVDFKAIPGEKRSADEVYNFNVDASVTDEAGETQTATTSIAVSNDPLELAASIPLKMLYTDSAFGGAIKLTNINGQPQKGKVHVTVNAVSSPGQTFVNRLWNKPDQYLLTKENFKKAFPQFAWKDEDVVSKWAEARQAANFDLAINDSTENKLDLSALAGQPGGIYKLTLKARSESGDTASMTYWITLVAHHNVPVQIGDWATPVKTVAKPGDKVVFQLGIGKPASILTETYDGPKLLSSAWLRIKDSTQKTVSMQVPQTIKKRFAVQFLLISDNRIYKVYPQLSSPDTTERLRLKFITFRDKLLPGQKEQWKLQVSNAGNEKLDAELLADMYDASLDQIMPQQYWQTSFKTAPYYPDYFEWTAQNFNSQVETDYVFPTDETLQLNEREYESLVSPANDYYGDYNNGYAEYQGRLNESKGAAQSDDVIRKKYRENAARVKDGFDMSGKIVMGLGPGGQPGAKITIKGTHISTWSDSHGYFRIKVPIKSILIISCKGFRSRQVKAAKGTAFVIGLYDNRYGWIRTGTPGLKGIQGDKNTDVTIDEPVGNADARVVEYNEVKFSPPVVKPDMMVADAKAVPLADSEKLLQGQAAGIQVINGAPGATSEVYIRGISSLTKPIIPRANFNETAFFYPQLHTDEKGQILIDFTIPEALTRWKFRGLAHTRDLASGYIEAEVVTQKQLSISANTPRFLREGDTITISARLANLTAGKLKGKVHLQLFNAVNMQPVNLFISKADAEQDFSVDANTNKAVSFKLAVPPGLDALDYRLTADAGDFTDGEENTLPVLTDRMLVTESMPMMVRAGQTKDFTFDKLVNQHSSTLQNKTLTLEYTANPAWYAVQALPYMMEFPYECSEQLFSRYFANSLATDIVNKNPAIKKVFEQWKSANSTGLLSNLEKNQELKSTLIEETPWLRDAENETEQKKRIALLFDLNKMSDELQQALDKLQKRQLPDGGFNWFGGDYADRYITQHIVEGMGELHHLHIGDSIANLQVMAGKAVGYLDDQLLNDERERKKMKDDQWLYGDLEIHAWFARSYFAGLTLIENEKNALDHYLTWAEGHWTYRNVYEQGLIALTMQRYGRSGVTAQIEKSLLETAQQSDELGMYWGKNQLGYYWYESPIETQSLLIELFTEAGDNAKAVNEMKIWLLRNKQTNNWKTTKATAAACYALLLKGSKLLADTNTIAIKIDGKPLDKLNPDVKADAGTGYLKTSWNDKQIKPGLGKVEIINRGKTVSWGALHWQYLENLDKITSANTNIRLRRKYFIQKQTDAGPVLTEVDAIHQPKVGDLLKVVVYLDADRDFEYVQLKDMRPAGTEPVDALSEYKYQDGLYYYQVTKDVATNFFISELPKGSYVFGYRLRVAQPGNFSTGITGIQCMYAPEFNAHSEGGRMVIRP